jgi:tRNA-dihydrouridine synthase B
MSIDVKSSFFIGKLKLANRLIQAPLAGISCAPFRELFSLFTKPAYTVSEMISANSILENNPSIIKRYLSKSKDEGKWCIQLSGNDPQTLAKAVRICEQYNPDLIDLNCGCPKPKIRSKGCGSALINSPTKLQEIIQAMREATELPLTVKIRTAGNSNDDSYLDAARIIAQAGADAIIVHGRHFSEDYTVQANYSQIKKITEIVKIPVIANGDIHDLISMEKALNDSQACAVMIARGLIGKPWLFEQLLGGNPSLSWQDKLKVFEQHITKLSILEESEIKAILQARRLLKWYFPELSQTQLCICYQKTKITNLIELLHNL